MESAWPEFQTKQPLENGRSWTARFDSYDQYRERCYYLIRVFDGDALVNEFMVLVDTEFPSETVQQMLPELTARLTRLAAGGTSNTDWHGYYSRQ